MCEYRSKNKSVLKRRIAQYSLFIFTPMLLGASAVQAQVVWTGTGSENWGDTVNWSGGQIPTGTDNIVINAGSGNNAIVDGQSFSVHKLVTGAAFAGSANDGEFHVVNGGNLTAEGFVILGEAAGTVGRAVVSGENSKFEINSVQFFLGEAGEGHLTIKDGGQFKTATDNIIFAGEKGNLGTSSFTVTGAGTRADIGTLLLSYTQLNVPSEHTTIFNVTDGAAVNAVQMNFAYSGKGIVNIDNATVNMSSITSGYREGSEGIALVSGENASLNIANLMQFGSSGKSTTLIEKGAYFKTGGSANLGVVSTGEGVVVINGAGSRWDALTNIYVGAAGKGAISIEDGGILDSKDVAMAFEGGSQALINVIGAGSLWTSTGTTFNAYDGKSHIGITDGGKAHLEEVYAANGADAYSTTLISGAQSELTVDGVLLAGAGGTSHLLAEKGAKVIAGYGAAGNQATSVGSITVTGEGTTFINTGEMAIGIEGKGNLTVTDKAYLSSADKIGLAEGAGSEGVLNIGTGGHAGFVEAPEITGGAGDATVNFNHIDRIDFDAAMAGNLNVNHVNQGATTLFGESDYTGTTKVSIGTYKAGKEGVFSENSHYIAANGGVIDLNNFDQSMEALTNQGRVYFGNIPGTELHVGNNYTGDGGTLYLSTVLGQDDSLTDRMYVGADTSGHSYVKVTNVGGLGALTKEGIKIIDVTGQSDGKFSLLGDYVYKGEQVVVGGAYRYKLNQGATSTLDDGNWYLQSEGYQKGVVPYEVYPQLLLNHLPTLQQRVGNRFWNNAGNKQLAQGADIPAGFVPPDETGVLIEENAVWGRMEGSHTSIKSRYSTSGADYDYNHFRMQAGIDGMLKETENGKLIGGLTAHYDRKNADIYARDIDSDIAINGYGFGGTLTWYGENGFYLDNQAEVTWYNSDIGADGALVNGNKGFGYSLSVETGKRITLNEYWSMTPQGQLIYANASFDSFRDRFGADVSRKKADSLEGRLGLTLDHQDSWLNDRGMMNRRYVYGIANLYAEFLDGTTVDVSGVRFSNQRDRVWGGLGLGGSYNWNDDKYSIYGEGLVTSSLNHFGESYGYKGTIGLRVKW